MTAAASQLRCQALHSRGLKGRLWMMIGRIRKGVQVGQHGPARARAQNQPEAWGQSPAHDAAVRVSSDATGHLPLRQGTAASAGYRQPRLLPGGRPATARYSRHGPVARARSSGRAAAAAGASIWIPAGSSWKGVRHRSPDTAGVAVLQLLTSLQAGTHGSKQKHCRRCCQQPRKPGQEAPAAAPAPCSASGQRSQLHIPFTVA